MTVERAQLGIGGLLAGAGFAAKMGALPPLQSYTYPVVWWGLLSLVDVWNARHRGLSLWQPRHLTLVTMPVSILFWVFFELLNLLAPQWRYRGAIRSVAGQVAFGAASFATVIPIMVESYWLVGGEPCLPRQWMRLVQANRPALLGMAAFVTLLPAFNKIFWFNQGMWLAPAFTLLPFLPMPVCTDTSSFLRRLAASGLLAGFVWEAINYRERTRWEYLILPRAPHLFEMPVLGYLGFIPFALSALAVHQLQQRVRPRPAIGALLWAGALGALWWSTRAYRRRGLWTT